MTFGRLSQDNEITALRSSGVNLGSALVGPLVAAAGLAVGLTLFNNHVLPESNHLFANLLIDIGRMRPTARLQEGTFITDFPGYNLLVQSVNGRTNEMRGVTIYQLNAGGPPTTILARRGWLSYTPDGRTAVLTLKDGEIHEVPPDEGGARRYRRLTFKTHVINIPGAGAILERTIRNTRSDREMSAASLYSQRDTLVHQFRSALEMRRDHFRQLGAAPEIVRAIGLEPGPWWSGWAAAWNRVRGREPVEAAIQRSPILGPETELWRLARETYRKQTA